MSKAPRVSRPTRFDRRRRRAVPSSSKPLGSRQPDEKKPGGAQTPPAVVIDDRNTDDRITLPGPRRRPKVMGAAFAALLERTARRVAAGTRSPATLDMQREHVRYLLERIPASTPLERVTSARIARALSAESRGRRRRPLSGGTLRKRASTLAQALELARGRSPRLPEIPYRYRPRAEHLEDLAQYARVRDRLKPRRRRWYVVGTWTGQRRRDVEEMRREDLHLEGRNPWMVVRSRKTGRITGVRVRAPRELVRELADHWRALPRGAKVVEPWPHVSSDLARLSERLGLPRLSAHRLRHTFFTWYVAANGFTAELLELGGWKDLTVPAQVYAHAAPARLREQIERVDRLVLGPRRAPHRASRKRDREPTSVGFSDGSGPAGVSPPAGPKPTHAGPRHVGGKGTRSDAPPKLVILPATGKWPTRGRSRNRTYNKRIKSPPRRASLTASSSGPPWVSTENGPCLRPNPSP